MTRDETINVLMTIQAAFPNFRVPDKTIATNIWFSLLGKYDYITVISAVEAYITSNVSGFPPAIGQIIDQVYALSAKDEVNEMEAWSMVQKAIKNSAYHAEEEFKKLPEIVQKAVPSPGQLKEWALTENLNVEVVSSNFMRTYRSQVAKEKENRKLNPDMLKIMQAYPCKNCIEDKTENNNQVFVTDTKKLPTSMPERARKRLKELLN